MTQTALETHGSLPEFPTRVGSVNPQFTSPELGAFVSCPFFFPCDDSALGHCRLTLASGCAGTHPSLHVCVSLVCFTMCVMLHVLLASERKHNSGHDFASLQANQNLANTTVLLHVSYSTCCMFHVLTVFLFLRVSPYACVFRVFL